MFAGATDVSGLITETYKPRVNAALLPKYHGRQVRVAGKIISREAGKVKLQTTDSQEIEIVYGDGLPAFSDEFAEFVCEVDDNQGCSCERAAVEFKKINLATLDKTIQFTHACPQKCKDLVKQHAV